jgi:hypothetical protein
MVGGAFRGLFRHLRAELREHRSEGFSRLELTFDTIDSQTGDRIRFSLTRAYSDECPFAWCVADLCEYAMQHEIQESLPALFEQPDHRPGELDRDEVAREHAARSLARYREDVATGRWRDGLMRERKPAW